MPALYTTDEGQPVITHSMIKTFRRCPRQALYKYHDRIKPKEIFKPLKRGVWIHALLETHFKGGNWLTTHQEYTTEFSHLFEEEQEKLGDLPNEIHNLMQSYFWHYRDDADWTVLETEFTFETEFPDGTLYRCRVDNLVETPFGIYLVDHKSHKVLPRLNFRLLDSQSPLYIWAARRCGIPVVGFIWNYIRTNGPSPVKLTKQGQLYKRQGETDFITARRDLRALGEDIHDPKWKAFMDGLKAMRYQHGAMQLSPFFRREILDKDDDMVKRAVKEAIHTTKRAHAYPFDKRDYVERVQDRSCEWGCGYTDLCVTELMGGNVALTLKAGFTGDADPLDYYKDEEQDK